MRRGRVRRPVLMVAGLVAAVLLITRGLLDLREGSGWAMLLVAAALLTALALRHFIYRD